MGLFKRRFKISDIISKNNDRRTKKVSVSKEHYFYRFTDEQSISFKPEELKIMKYLADNGVPIEEPISYDAVHNEGENLAMFYKSSGLISASTFFYGVDFIELSGKFSKFSFMSQKLLRFNYVKLRIKFFHNIINIISKMHSLKVAHNHPHTSNFVIDKNLNVKLIDFKLAKMHDGGFIDVQDKLNFFRDDYMYLFRSFRVFFGHNFSLLEMYKLLKLDGFEGKDLEYAIAWFNKDIIPYLDEFEY